MTSEKIISESTPSRHGVPLTIIGDFELIIFSMTTRKVKSVDSWTKLLLVRHSLVLHTLSSSASLSPGEGRRTTSEGSQNDSFVDEDDSGSSAFHYGAESLERETKDDSRRCFGSLISFDFVLPRLRWIAHTRADIRGRRDERIRASLSKKRVLFFISRSPFACHVLRSRESGYVGRQSTVERLRTSAGAHCRF